MEMLLLSELGRANQPAFSTDLTTFAYGLLLDPAATSSVTLNGRTPNGYEPHGLARYLRRNGPRRFEQPRVLRALERRRGVRAPRAIRKPLVSIAGSADVFITPANDAETLFDAVNASGNDGHFWQYLVTDGIRVGTFARLGYGLQPQLPFAWRPSINSPRSSNARSHRSRRSAEGFVCAATKRARMSFAADDRSDRT